MKRVLPMLAAAGLLATACNYDGRRPTHLSDAHGDATMANSAAMVEDPAAGNQEAVQGLDGRSAEHVLDNYSKGQSAQEHPRTQKKRGSGILIGEMK